MNLERVKVSNGEVAVGDLVEFKCDVEQCGRISAIKRDNWGGTTLTLSGHFFGEYIGGLSTTTVPAEDCWI